MNNNTNKVINPMKVITGPDTRWSYANVWEAKSINGGTPKFSVSLIIPKSDTKTVAKVKAAIEAAYHEGESKLKGNGKAVPPMAALISDCASMRQMLSDTTALDAELASLNEEITVVAELVKACVRENASTAQSQEEYAKKYNGLLARYEKATARLAEVTAEKERKLDQDREIRLFIEALKKQPLVLEKWDERLWIAIVDRAMVFREGKIVFKFKSGSEIEVER